MQHSDEEIIALLSSEESRKNDQGIRLLYEYFFSMIAKLVLSNSGTNEDVEEVFQDAAFVLFNKCKKGELVLSCKLKTYLYSVCRNIWLKSLNQKRVSTVSIQDHEDFVAIDASFFKQLQLSEERQTMLTLIGQLGADCQKLLYLFYYEQLKMKEIARLMPFANDQVARNKKVKCLKQLIKIVDEAPFFRNYFK